MRFVTDFAGYWTYLDTQVRRVEQDVDAGKYPEDGSEPLPFVANYFLHKKAELAKDPSCDHGMFRYARSSVRRDESGFLPYILQKNFAGPKQFASSATTCGTPGRRPPAALCISA